MSRYIPVFALACAFILGLATFAHARTKDDAVVVTADPIIYLDVDEGDAHCSGFIINAVTIGTAAHCEQDSKKNKWLVKDSIGRTYPAEPIYVDAIHDLALFKLSGINKLVAEPAPIGCNAPVAVGDDVNMVGYPHNQGKVTAFGKVSAMPSPDMDGTWPDVYRIQIFGAPGSSGSAVFNKAGQVIAILVGMGSPDEQGMMEAVPVADLCHPSVI